MKARSATTIAMLIMLTGCGPAASAARTASLSPSVSPEPDTAAGARAAAQVFDDLYSAGQYAAMWPLMDASARKSVPQRVWTEVHAQCPAPTAGLARTIKRVTMAGNVALVTETLAGSLGKLGSVVESYVYSGGRWLWAPTASDLSYYRHGSVAADVAAARVQHMCGK